MRKAIIYLFLLFIPVLINGQVQIRPIPNGALTMGNTISVKDWQWDITTTQFLGDPVFLEVKIVTTTGQVVYKIASFTFTLANSTSITRTNFNQIETELVGNDYRQMLTHLNCLPKGKYQIVATLFSIKEMTAKPIGQSTRNWYQRQSCYQPIALITPIDKTVLCNQPLIFQWDNSLPNVLGNYTLEIFEQFSHQTPQQAISVNQPLLTQDLRVPVFSMNTTINPLEKEKTYLWRILKKQTQHIIAQSPVRSFQLSCTQKSTIEDEPKKLEKSKIYFRMGTRANPPQYNLKEAVLNFSYLQRNYTDKYTLEIKNNQGNTLNKMTISSKIGYNYQSLSFEKLGIENLSEGAQLLVLLNSTSGENVAFTVKFQPNK